MQKQSSIEEPLEPSFSETNFRMGLMPRDVERVVMHIDVEPTNGATIEGLHLHQGEHYIKVYEDRVDAVLRQCWTEEEMNAREAARRMADRAIEHWIKDKLGDVTEEQAEKEIDRLKVMCPLHWTQFIRQAADSIGIKRPHHNLTLRAAKVVQTGVPAPDSRRKIERENQLNQANSFQELTAVLKSVVSGNGPSGDFLDIMSDQDLRLWAKAKELDVDKRLRGDNLRAAIRNASE